MFQMSVIFFGGQCMFTTKQSKLRVIIDESHIVCETQSSWKFSKLSKLRVIAVTQGSLIQVPALTSRCLQNKGNFRESPLWRINLRRGVAHKNHRIRGRAVWKHLTSAIPSSIQERKNSFVVYMVRRSA